MVSSVTFRNFRALRTARIALGPFNLVVGPNGSGKSTLIDAFYNLQRTVARLPEGSPAVCTLSAPGTPEVWYEFPEGTPPLTAHLTCGPSAVFDHLCLEGDIQVWPTVRERLRRWRHYDFQHRAMAASQVDGPAELTETGDNLCAALGALFRSDAKIWAELQRELHQILPEYDAIVGPWERAGSGWGLRWSGTGEWVPAAALSQGTLYLLGVLVLAFTPNPPAMVTLEEVDRGFHPRWLRSVRDLFYRLSHPRDFGLERDPVQVLMTSHSPYVLDLFRDHPEEVLITTKEGSEATVQRLQDLPDIEAVLEEGGSLGDLWFAGVLGGVPKEDRRGE